MPEGQSRLCINITEEQRTGLNTVFCGYHGMQQRTISLLVDKVIELAAKNQDLLMSSVCAKTLTVRLDRGEF